MVVAAQPRQTRLERHAEQRDLEPIQGPRNASRVTEHEIAGTARTDGGRTRCEPVCRLCAACKRVVRRAQTTATAGHRGYESPGGSDSAGRADQESARGRRSVLGGDYRLDALRAPGHRDATYCSRSFRRSRTPRVELRSAVPWEASAPRRRLGGLAGPRIGASTCSIARGVTPVSRSTARERTSLSILLRSGEAGSCSSRATSRFRRVRRSSEAVAKLFIQARHSTGLMRNAQSRRMLRPSLLR